MFRHNWLIIPILAGVVVGCDSRQRHTVKSNPATMPTTVPATTQPLDTAAGPTTEPATQPASSSLMIDGQVYKFPSARLRVSRSNGHVVARLYTNDPKTALEDDYKGNSFDLKMRLDDISEPQQVYTSVWQFKAPSREYANSPYGIFLEGMKHQLQPFNATARFLGDMLLVRIDLDGQFLEFDMSDPSLPPKTVFVKGSLLAPVEYKD